MNELDRIVTETAQVRPQIFQFCVQGIVFVDAVSTSSVRSGPVPACVRVLASSVQLE